jgi:NAD(P)-dependent dehydrogenase (short-subunit alcohol dehydrogenase family)
MAAVDGSRRKERLVELNLQGGVAVVTGASKGIGLAVTTALAAEGARVVAGARTSTAELDALVEGGRVRAVSVDLAEPDAPARLVEAAGDRVDILVNNVGAAIPRLGGFLEITDEQWATSLTLNLLAAVRTTRAAIPRMPTDGTASIVNVCSVNAILPDPAVLDYCAAKGALLNFSKALSKELGPSGIRVNTVSPGPVETALWLGSDGVAQRVARASGQSADDVAAGAAAQSVTGRFTRPEEVADLVVLLASGRAGNVTGADFTIDGGLITTI